MGHGAARHYSFSRSGRDVGRAGTHEETSGIMRKITRAAEEIDEREHGGCGPCRSSRGRWFVRELRRASETSAEVARTSRGERRRRCDESVATLDARSIGNVAAAMPTLLPTFRNRLKTSRRFLLRNRPGRGGQRNEQQPERDAWICGRRNPSSAWRFSEPADRRHPQAPDQSRSLARIEPCGRQATTGIAMNEPMPRFIDADCRDDGEQRLQRRAGEQAAEQHESTSS